MELLLLLFILGYLAQAVANMILIRRIMIQQTVDGLTINTQICYMLGSLSRLVWTFETRLTNTYIIWVELAANILLFSYTQSKEFGNPFSWKYLLPFNIVASWIWHPGQKNDYYFTKQMFVSFTMFMEASGLLPQLYNFYKRHQVEIMFGDYIFCLAVSRFLRLLFWYKLYYDGDSFICLMVADLLHTVLLSDFTYKYLKDKNKASIIDM